MKIPFNDDEKAQSKKSEKITFDCELSTKKIEINKSALKNPQIK